MIYRILWFFCVNFRLIFSLFVCCFIPSCVKKESQVVIANMSEINISIKKMMVNEDVSIKKTVVVEPLREKNISFSVFYGNAYLESGDVLKFEYSKNDIKGVMSCEVKEDFCVYYVVYKDDGYYCYCDSLRDVGD